MTFINLNQYAVLLTLQSGYAFAATVKLEQRCVRVTKNIDLSQTLQSSVPQLRSCLQSIAYKDMDTMPLTRTYTNHTYQESLKGKQWLRSQPTFIKLFAFIRRPKVVCLEESGPNGTISFNFSKQYLKFALL